MENRWSDDRAAEFIGKYGDTYGDDLAIGLFVASLIGAEAKLVLHGGGNSSVKTNYRNLFGESKPAIFVKASGRNMAFIEPNGLYRDGSGAFEETAPFVRDFRRGNGK